MAIRAVKHDAAIAVGATRMARVKLPTVTAPAAADCNTKVRLTMSLLWNSSGLREKINIVLACSVAASTPIFPGPYRLTKKPPPTAPTRPAVTPGPPFKTAQLVAVHPYCSMNSVLARGVKRALGRPIIRHNANVHQNGRWRNNSPRALVQSLVEDWANCSWLGSRRKRGNAPIAPTTPAWTSVPTDHPKS